uniref:Zinc finger SWIM-type containing 3 n=1 Tax=Buteo japonicus TaxID=224669 RepID=A0A8B9Z4Q7_9AVES
MVAGQPVDGAPAPYRAPALPEAAKENASALIRVAEVMKSFLRVDRGSLASISADSNHGLDRLSFQTSKMKSSFMQFPKSLLLHRALSDGGHVLYALLVESEERVGKVVHLSLLKDDTASSIRKMLTVFKEFNPEWQKVQTVFVDVSFFHKAILQELFPAAQVFLSVYHTVRLLEKNVREAEISSSLKQNLTLALQKAVFSPSAASLDALSQLVKRVVSPELYNYLRANCFSCELLWCLHAEKGLQSCGTHMDSLDLITHRISSLFGRQPSLEASVLCFLECAAGAGTDSMLATLWESCTDLGSWLCLKEWEVVQTSTQLLSPVPGSLTVQLLEDAHRVSRDCRSCSCCFHHRYRLPCRHVLMHALLRDLVAPDLLPQLHIRWLLDDEIWAAHRERSWGEASNYFRDLEIVTQGLSQVFSVELSLESCITSLARHYQKCVSKSPPDAATCSAPHPDHCAAWAAPQSLPASGSPLVPVACQGKLPQSSVQASPTTAAAQQQQPVPASLTAAEGPVMVLQSRPAAPQLPAALQHQPVSPQALLLQREPMSPQSSLDPSSPVAKLEATENLEGDSEEEINRRTEEGIKQSLSDICTEPAARLCLSEFAVVQKSVQLIGTGEDALSIQVLEDAHRVNMKGPSSCTCHFNQVFQLPCRHILAALNSDRKTLQPEMLSRQWQKGCDAHQAGQDSADGLLEILKSSWNESLDKSLVVSFLTAEVSRLLTHCSREEFEHRYRTLRELADSWIGPYVEVKL